MDIKISWYKIGVFDKSNSQLSKTTNKILYTPNVTPKLFFRCTSNYWQMKVSQWLGIQHKKITSVMVRKKI